MSCGSKTGAKLCRMIIIADQARTLRPAARAIWPSSAAAQLAREGASVVQSVR